MSGGQQQMSLVVVGNGMVGHHLLSELHENATSDLAITVLGEEPQAAYDRVHLSELFAGKSLEDLSLGDVRQYGEWRIDAHLGDPVVQIDRQHRCVITRDGAKYAYDKLVLATGSYPFVPPIPGSDQSGCFVYRTIADLEQIRRRADDATSGIVIGGGLLGLECANALKNLGLETSVVEFAPGLMGVQLDGDGSDMLKAHIENLGVAVHTNKQTQRIVSIDGDPENPSALCLEFADGETLSADMVVFSAGIRPHDALARDAGLAVGERGGVVIDHRCLTSDPDIYAIGECALFEHKIFGLVAPGYRMAEVVATQLLGSDASFNGADMSTKLKLLGVDVGSIGDAHGRAEDSISYTYVDPIRQTYQRMNVSADGSRVLGAVLVGDCEGYDQLLQYYLNALPLPEQPETLLLPQVDGGATLQADQLPDAAVICSCHNVNKGEIVSRIVNGCTELSELKQSTKASTGCGGCAAQLKSIFDHQLTELGIEVDRSICEHFKYTRQELFHLCQIEHIRDMNTLLERHGTGLGCDICKPAAASIFASLYNEHILDKPHIALQDTNDRMLANMQKNGTYSVVPRIPGGEITPDKLIAIGQVAKRYDLYTKITGGQRIDLFGAQAHELPAIWSELIDAGFETGHAYGKALRTVKSCVGSTWCRYGVQDSVSMALLIENRYKGLRAPHKIKMAVSGCTRECAEAQSKDVGVIATENGWNLYVGGNGGMRPRHADLFATDLDDATLIRWIDRFLMFYVRTADRLQRTSVWLNNLEGGLAYLQDVIIRDSLGLGPELEAQMANIVGTYQCEWQTALNDPEKMKYFRQFVNTDAADPDVIFVREREQRRPASAEERIELLAVEAQS